MFESLKKKIAYFIVNRRMKESHTAAQSFNNLFASSYNFLVIMPEDENDFQQAVDVLSFLYESGKNFAVFTYDYRVSLIPAKFRRAVVDYSMEDLSGLMLPSVRLKEKLASMEFNTVLDLNRKESLFNSYSANLVKAKLRVGFSKYNSDNYYNFQVANLEDNAQIVYKIFLNCLQMF